jgi:hypothetical protein
MGFNLNSNESESLNNNISQNYLNNLETPKEDVVDVSSQRNHEEPKKNRPTKNKLFLALMITALCGLGFYVYSAFLTKPDINTLLTKTYNNMNNATSFKYDVILNLKSMEKDPLTPSLSLEEELEKEIVIPEDLGIFDNEGFYELNFNTHMDLIKKDILPDFSSSYSLEFLQDSEKYNLGVDLIKKENHLFLKINKIPEIVKMLMGELKLENTWIKVDLAELTEASREGTEAKNLQKRTKDQVDIIINTFFSNINFDKIVDSYSLENDVYVIEMGVIPFGAIDLKNILIILSTELEEKYGEDALLKKSDIKDEYLGGTEEGEDEKIIKSIDEKIKTINKTNKIKLYISKDFYLKKIEIKSIVAPDVYDEKEKEIQVVTNLVINIDGINSDIEVNEPNEYKSIADFFSSLIMSPLDDSNKDFLLHYKDMEKWE